MSTEEFSQSKRKIIFYLSVSHKIKEKGKKRLLIAGGNELYRQKSFILTNFLTSFPVFFPVLLAGRDGATSCVSALLIARASVSQPQIQLGMWDNSKYSPSDGTGIQYLVSLEKCKYWIKIIMEGLGKVEIWWCLHVSGDWMHWHSDVLASIWHLQHLIKLDWGWSFFLNTASRLMHMLPD